MAHVYGGDKDVSLHIFHGTNNASFVSNICNGWSGVQLHCLGVENLTIRDYNMLLTDPAFWEHITSEYALVFQTDTLIFRKIDPIFFDYDYVGAPWPFWVSPTLPSHKNVGNGGFSLRRTQTMKNICIMRDTIDFAATNEDVFFAERVAQNRLPNVEIATRFSVEHIFYPNPCGIHQAWRFHMPEELKVLLQNIPGKRTI